MGFYSPYILPSTFIKLIPYFFLKFKISLGPELQAKCSSGHTHLGWGSGMNPLCFAKQSMQPMNDEPLSFSSGFLSTHKFGPLLKISDFQIKSSFEFRWLGEPKGIVLVFATFKTSLFSLNQSVKVFLQFRRYVRNRFAIKMHSRAICIKMYSTVMT